MRKILRGDKVRILSGKDRGKEGKVVQVFPKEDLLVVEGVRKTFRHLKAQGQQKGQKIEYNAPVRTSTVMLICPNCNKPSRVGFVTTGGKKQRSCKHCKQPISTSLASTK